MSWVTSALQMQAVWIAAEQPISALHVPTLSPADLRTVITLAVISASLMAGLAAAYGRELQARRQVDRSWWIARALLLPMLAICALSASAILQLSQTMTASASAMLALGGYDGLRLIEARWQARVLGEQRSTNTGSEGQSD